MTTFDLRAWRKRMGYTVSEAAEALGLSRQRFKDNIYIPDKRPPSARTIELAQALEREKRDADHL